MSTDYAEKEREFLATLEEDTGRSLGQWMAVISSENLADKNDVIDWLRAQGFMFWKASWLERIHSNGGKPIYAGIGAAAATDGAPVIDTAPPAVAPASQPAVTIDPEVVASAPWAAPPATSEVSPLKTPPDLPAIEELVVRGKALAPLARHMMREIQRAVPACQIQPSHNALVFRTEREFAVLVIGPKELKLGLALGVSPITAPFVAARFPAPAYRVPAGMTHMVGLADVRQAGPEVVDAIRQAAALASQ